MKVRDRYLLFDPLSVGKVTSEVNIPHIGGEARSFLHGATSDGLYDHHRPKILKESKVSKGKYMNSFMSDSHKGR